MGYPAAASTRLHLANERTLLAWTKLASIIGAGGFLNRLLLPPQLLVEKDHALRSMQTVHLSLAFIVLVSPVSTASGLAAHSITVGVAGFLILLYLCSDQLIANAQQMAGEF